MLAGERMDGDMSAQRVSTSVHIRLNRLHTFGHHNEEYTCSLSRTARGLEIVFL